MADDDARLAEVRQVAVNFARHHVVLNPQAEALWHAVLQVTDRDGPGEPPPDPETPLSDALHALGEVRMKAESMLMSDDPVVRSCGEQMLAVLGTAGQERSDEKGGQLPFPQAAP
jgi:hypothetical protein